MIRFQLSVVDGIPLACKGNDYGVIGNELLTSTTQGRSYGAEVLVKWLIAKKLTWLLLSPCSKVNTVTIKKVNTSHPHGITDISSIYGELTISRIYGVSE